jgi:hypothetical protein
MLNSQSLTELHGKGFSELTPSQQDSISQNHKETQRINSVLEILFDFEFSFASSPTQFIARELSIAEAFHVIKSGLIDNQPIAKVKLFTVIEATDAVSFIYDIAASKSGNSPWNLLEESIESEFQTPEVMPMIQDLQQSSSWPGLPASQSEN